MVATAETPRGSQPISGPDFDRMRFGWLEAVRHDRDLSMTAKMLAHVLALDYANRLTGQCNPSHVELAAALNVSDDTIKRAVEMLVSGGWIVRETGRGRGRRSGYSFRSKGVVIALKGGKFAGIKGGKNAGLNDSEKGANLRHKRVQNCGSYIEPCFNHSARPSADAPEKGAAKALAPGLRGDVDLVVRRALDGRHDALEPIAGWRREAVASAVRESGLLTEAQLTDAGIF